MRGPRRTIIDSPVIVPLRWLSRLWLKLIGWRLAGRLPACKKYVVIVAPHTSNWDFPIALAFDFVLGLKAFWVGKHTLFRGPFKPLLEWLGGQPVDRRSPQNITTEMVKAFAENEEFVFALAPEGTRKRAETWKSGFYHVAAQAGVPILMAYLDYAKKEAGLGPLITLTGDIEADMARIREFYATVTAKNPGQFAEPRLAP